MPVTQGVWLKSSSSPRAPPTTSKPVEGKRGNVTQQGGKQPKTAPKAPKDKSALESTTKPQEASADGFTTPAKNKVVPVTRDSKQESFAEQAASTNSFAPTLDWEKRSPKLAAHLKLSADTRQPSPSQPSIEQTT